MAKLIKPGKGSIPPGQGRLDRGVALDEANESAERLVLKAKEAALRSSQFSKRIEGMSLETRFIDWS